METTAVRNHSFTHGEKVWNAGYAAPKTLDDEQLRRFAPSIFAETPHPRMSEKYGFIPTISVVNALREEGFVPVRAQENWVREGSGNAGFARHALRFRAVSEALARDFFVGDSIFEIALTNSHNGSAGYSIEAALFRFACSNGLLIADSTVERISVRHTRRVVEDAIAGTFRIVAEAPKVVAAIDRFRKVELTDRERTAFARGALELRWPTEEVRNTGGGATDDVRHVRTAPVMEADLLRPRRFEDQGTDLWSTLNVVQEHLTKGGDRGRASTGRKLTTRGIKAISEDQRVNRALWAYAEAVAERKAA